MARMSDTEIDEQVEQSLRVFLEAADERGIVKVLGGPEARLPKGYAVALARGLCGYPQRTPAGIAVRLT